MLIIIFFFIAVKGFYLIMVSIGPWQALKYWGEGHKICLYLLSKGLLVSRAHWTGVSPFFVEEGKRSGCWVHTSSENWRKWNYICAFLRFLRHFLVFDGPKTLSKMSLTYETLSYNSTRHIYSASCNIFWLSMVYLQVHTQVRLQHLPLQVPLYRSFRWQIYFLDIFYYLKLCKFHQ